MSYAKVCAQCERDFVSRRPDAETCSEECKYQNWIERGVQDAQPVTHPLQLVRDQAALDKHTRDLNGLIRQAIIDAIKTTGDCHADDLHDLYPVGEVDRCRELATRQFASLRSGKNPLIAEKERRASSIPARKRAKSGVYIFTRYGREQLVGSCANTPGGVQGAGSPASSRPVPHVGAASSQSNENVGLSAAAQLDPSLGGPAGSGRSIEPGDLTPGPVPKNHKSGAVKSPPTVATDTGSPDSEVLQLDEAKRPSSSMYDAWEAA